MIPDHPHPVELEERGDFLFVPLFVGRQQRAQPLAFLVPFIVLLPVVLAPWFV